MKIVGISVAVLVSLVVLGSVLMPIIDESVDGKEYTNASAVGDIRFGSYMGEDFKALVDTTASTVTFTDGTIIDISDSVFANKTLIYSDNIIIRAVSGGLQMFANTGSGSWYQVLATDGNYVEWDSDTKTFTVKYGTNGTYTSTVPATFCYAPKDGGDYVLSTTDKYIREDSSIIVAGGRTDSGVQKIFTTFDTTIEDLDVDVWVAANSSDWLTSTVTNLAANSTDLGHGISKLSSITFTVTANNVDTGVTYTYFLVPEKVTADPDFTGGAASILSIVPMLIIVAILLGVIALVIRSRME